MYKLNLPLVHVCELTAKGFSLTTDIPPVGVNMELYSNLIMSYNVGVYTALNLPDLLQMPVGEHCHSKADTCRGIIC